MLNSIHNILPGTLFLINASGSVAWLRDETNTMFLSGVYLPAGSFAAFLYYDRAYGCTFLTSLGTFRLFFSDLIRVE